MPLLELVVRKRPDPINQAWSHPGLSAEDAGFEPARAINPTRVPGERHRPLGESSVGHGSRAPLGDDAGRNGLRRSRAVKRRSGSSGNRTGRGDDAGRNGLSRRRAMEPEPGTRLSVDPARRLSRELPQGRKAARVNGLWRVRGVPYVDLVGTMKGGWCRTGRSAP